MASIEHRPGSAAGPVTLVTGAGQGIGAACGRRLAADGHRVLLFSRGKAVQSLADELRSHGLDAQAVRGSVTEPADLERLVETAVEVHGRIDGAVISTGHPASGELLELRDEDWHQALDLVVLNTVRLARLLVPLMERQGGGSLVNISTFGAVEPSLRFPLSSALRSALAGFTKLFADRYAAAGIRMNSVLPGFADSYEVDETTRRSIPMGREARVAEMASAVAFLLGEGASYITGQSLRVDGGLTRSL